MDDSQTDKRMNILAIECSHPCASLCLSLDGKMTTTAHWEAERNHDSYLFPALQQALEFLADKPLDYVLVGAGPGSYGGVRVALAAAVGISTVKGAKVVAVGSWDSLAEDGSCIISDARRGGWTLRRADGRIEVLPPPALLAEIENGLVVSSIESAQVLEKAGIKAQRTSLRPTAEGLVNNWCSLTPERRAELEARPAEPIYVRPPHITEAKRKPWEVRN